ncbi:alkaline shock response membrane anchor protein AmaP [Actinoplanes hulinensis]|uniref:Alkaline shock response membrane anchor protein AmaP n=1 Tax=Actinoplanes hulinensis TaxID=1144547 RepID=A0ABS7BG20_9ACTN|nr:alkaline shock response membrane anchor protein AmaP [Actinoplanes hulinensis]MBW6439805.1 alkaline shock response membrane anchor protein AmaP [Actinoplanes hulinensis]
MHADRASRVLLGLIGLTLTAAGVAGLLAGGGRFGADLPDSPVLDSAVIRFAAENSTWWWPAVAATGVVMALLGGWWLLAVLFSTDRIHGVRFATDPTAGATTLAGGAVNHAIDAEIEAYRGVRAASSRLLGTPEEPELAVNVTVDQSADIGALSQRIEIGALTHARQALGRPDLPAALDITVSRRPAGRVDRAHQLP